MTYEQAVTYIEEKNPKEMKLGLERLKNLLLLMENPQQELRYVHVAGTNGKGSFVAFLSEILIESGYTAGRFTSPWIQDYREQIQVNNQWISPEDFVRLTEYLQKHVMQMEQMGMDIPTGFELLTALAILYFKEQHCDFAIMETGMGGITDATNVIPVPELAILMEIQYDHMKWLGDTLPIIAEKKAGIIKSGGKVLVYPQNEEVMEVFQSACNSQTLSQKAELIMAELPKNLAPDSASLEGQSFHLSRGALAGKKLFVSMSGDYQIPNAAMAVNAALQLRKQGFPVSDEEICRGLKKAVWPGRFEVLRQNPVFLADGGHNPAGIQMLVQSLKRYFPDQKIIFITGVLADKDYRKMYEEILPMAESFYTITPPNPRALQAEQLADYLSEKGKQATACNTISEAVALAVHQSGNKIPVCSFGSLYYMGELRKQVLALPEVIKI